AAAVVLLGADEDGADAFALGDVDQVVDGDALRLPFAVRNLVHAELEDPARLRQEEHRRVRVRDQKMLGVVRLPRSGRSVAGRLRLGAPEPDAAALLGTEGARRLALDVAAVGEGDDDLLLRDE